MGLAISTNTTAGHYVQWRPKESATVISGPIVKQPEIEHIGYVQYGKRLFSITPELLFKPEFDEVDRYFYFKDDSLGMFVCGDDISQVRRNLSEEIAFIYDEYVTVDPNTLSPAAKTLHANAAARIKE